jgi:hypothetical protein
MIHAILLTIIIVGIIIAKFINSNTSHGKYMRQLHKDLYKKKI